MWLNLPWRKGTNLHMISPNTKSRRSVPTNVNGIQKTPNKISETAKFNKNTFVIVRIRRFCTNVKITSPFPTTANNSIIAYNGISSRPLDNQSIHDVVTAAAAPTFCVVIGPATVDETDKLVFETYCTWCWGITDVSWYSVSLSSNQVTFCKNGINVDVSFNVIALIDSHEILS